MESVAHGWVFQVLVHTASFSCSRNLLQETCWYAATASQWMSHVTERYSFTLNHQAAEKSMMPHRHVDHERNSSNSVSRKQNLAKLTWPYLEPPTMTLSIKCAKARSLQCDWSFVTILWAKYHNISSCIGLPGDEAGMDAPASASPNAGKGG